MTSSIRYFDRRQHEPGHAADEHQHQPEREPPAPRPDERAGLLPGGGPADLLLLAVATGPRRRRVASGPIARRDLS